uniref:NADH-ubiquinone oxidoreductase chain 6 n=1 Tax=Dasypogon diadema TaxID=468822 RepID=A0A5S9H8J0_9MUSC|nr:NADH dehydrogenase subunit 6 [Dasypogon diadema]AYW52664.1 NADH dehydrogenase subunit 6 [Dasypogon diadema]
MIKLVLYMLTVMSGILFMQMNHPLAMGLMLLIQTLLICLTSGLMTQTFWFSYMLFLIFLGGMLVLFIYVTSLASNEMFTMSMTLFMMTVMFMMLSGTVLLFTDKTLLYQFMENNEMMKTELINYPIKENSVVLTKLYNFPTSMITVMLINYLLITLIVTIKITNIFYGPLRQMN